MEVQKNQNVRIAPIQSVERAIWILKCFDGRTALSLTEISKMVSIHKSTVFGLVSTLEAYRFLEKNQETGKYQLGIELFRLGCRVNVDLRSIVTPYLDKVAKFTGETTNFLLLDGDSVIYQEKKESVHSMRISTVQGQREPLYRTAGGKAILANLPTEEVWEILDNTRFERKTSNTLLSVKDVQRDLAQTRSRGYAIDNEEMEYGLTCIGVAILDSNGKPLGAISVSGPTTRMTPVAFERYAPYLIDCARQISAHL